MVICDAYDPASLPASARRLLLQETANNPERPFPQAGSSAPISIEDNVWIGFGSIILPGVRIGRGSIVSCQTVIRESVPPYTVVAGDPPRAVRKLSPDDDEVARQAALATCLRQETPR